MNKQFESICTAALLLCSLAACGSTRKDTTAEATPTEVGVLGQVSAHTVVISPEDLLSDVGTSLLTVTIERNGGDVDPDVVETVKKSITLVNNGEPIRFELSTSITRSQAGMAVGVDKGQPTPAVTHPVRGNAVITVSPLAKLDAGWYTLSVIGAKSVVRDLVPVPGRPPLSATFAPGSAPILRSLRACKKGDGPMVGYIEFSEGVINPDQTLVRDASGASCSFVSASDVALEKKPLASTTYKVDGCDLSKGFQLTNFSSASAVSGKPLSVDPSGAEDRTGVLSTEVVSGCRIWVPN